MAPAIEDQGADPVLLQEPWMGAADLRHHGFLDPRPRVVALCLPSRKHPPQRFPAADNGACRSSKSTISPATDSIRSCRPRKP